MNAYIIKRKRLLLYPAMLVVTLVWASQYSSSSPVSPDIEWFDKVAHFFVFGLMGTLVFRVIDLPLKSRRRWSIALIAVLLYSSVDETIQYYNPFRTADWMDLVADALGSSVAVFVYRNWTFYRHLMEWPLFGTKSEV